MSFLFCRSISVSSSRAPAGWAADELASRLVSFHVFGRRIRHVYVVGLI